LIISSSKENDVDLGTDSTPSLMCITVLVAYKAGSARKSRRGGDIPITFRRAWGFTHGGRWWCFLGGKHADGL